MGGDVRRGYWMGGTALIQAAMCGDSSVGQLLLEHQSPVNHSDYHGWTALMYAAVRGHTSTVTVLLSHGLD